ncbi:hypothetical protein Bbelb_385170 [Branchiostoma belcheri]|nr:hypothetical protein Bbelb_385170 [Branchiostoma belcheri]
MPKQVCEDPTLIDYRIKDLLKRLITPEEIVVFNLPFTMLCLNADQPDGKCEDYEVRFCCPDVVPECPEGCSWTEWFDEDDPDDGVDFESIDKVLENNGPDAACPNPKASQARVVATEVDSSLSGQSVTLSRDSKSFLCLNGFQAGTEKCYDYEIRFCCPDKPGEDESPSDETPSDETPPGESPSDQTSRIELLARISNFNNRPLSNNKR